MFRNLSPDSRLTARFLLDLKVWKVRVQGYEEAQKTFRQQDSEKSPEFGKYVGLMKGFVTDSNAVAQDKGLDAAIEFVKNAAIANK